MTELSIDLLKELEVVKDTDTPFLSELYEKALEHLNLSAIDYLTIRDLLNISGHSHRSLHCVLLALFESLHSGNVCLHLNSESLETRLSPIISSAVDAVTREILKKITGFPELVHTVDRSRPSLFSDQSEAFKPIIHVVDGERRYLYFQKYFKYEELFRENLDRILSLEVRDSLTGEEVNAIDEIIHRNPVRRPDPEGGMAPLAYDRDQVTAMVLPLLSNLVIISGGPGTGKTSIVLNMLRLFTRLGTPVDRISIAAPTGLAAKRLAQAIHSGLETIAERNDIDESIYGIDASTIHRLMRYNPSRNRFLHGKNNPLEADVLILDEISMVDLILISKLLESVGSHTRVVLLGDKNQLPSIDAGAILADLIPEEGDASLSSRMREALTTVVPDMEPVGPNGREHPLTDRIVMLTKSYRSTREIWNTAGMIHSGSVGAVKRIPDMHCDAPFPESGVYRVTPETNRTLYSRELYRFIERWIEKHYLDIPGESYLELAGEASRFGGENMEKSEFIELLERLFSIINRSRILTPARNGISGTVNINRFCAESFSLITENRERTRLFSGAPIIVTKNDYQKDLFNGDVGLILSDREGTYRAFFKSENGFRNFPVRSLAFYDLSFAITVHKSQGSEYDNLLFIIDEKTSDRLLTREILYTGMTRAKKLAVLYSNPCILEKAVTTVIRRDSGLMIKRN